METLYKYIIKDFKAKTELDDSIWDGHIHLFNHDTQIQKYNFEKCVGFMDIEYDKENINVLGSYTNYIENYWDKDKEILLATGVTIEDIKSVYEKYKDIIYGFGELKCYDMYNGEKVPYKKIKFVKDVVKLSDNNGRLPVYVHWEFNNVGDVKKFENVLKTYPNVPIVLCHCGMNEYNQEFAYAESIRLQKEHSNLWLDITWDAAFYFAKNYFTQLDKLDRDRIILGTDINNRLLKKDDTNVKNKKNALKIFNSLRHHLMINNSDKICKLFNIKRT